MDSARKPCDDAHVSTTRLLQLGLLIAGVALGVRAYQVQMTNLPLTTALRSVRRVPFTTVRYEDFVADPGGTVERVVLACEPPSSAGLGGHCVRRRDEARFGPAVPPSLGRARYERARPRSFFAVPDLLSATLAGAVLPAAPG